MRFSGGPNNMTSFIRLNPFETNDLPTGLRLFQNFLSESESNVRPWTPGVDIVENENALVLTADVPGVELKDIEIQLEQGTLSIKGTRKFEKDETATGYHRIERSYGSFARTFTLPETVEVE